MCRTPFNPFQLRSRNSAFLAMASTGLRRALTAV
jgi:hypothetical protein